MRGKLLERTAHLLLNITQYDALQVDDLRNGALKTMRGTRLQVYEYDALFTNYIHSHLLAPKTEMKVYRLLHLVHQDGKLLDNVRWKGLSTTDNTLKILHSI